MPLVNMKSWDLIGSLLSITGLIFIVSGGAIRNPDFDSLEKVSLVITKSEVVTSGKNYPVFKFLASDDCAECYYWSYAIDQDDYRYYEVPDDSNVNVWVKKSDFGKQSKFAWQVWANSKMLISYKDVISIEAERRFILLGFGTAFFLVFMGWILYKKRAGSGAT